MNNPQHIQEWVNSGIDPTLIELNLLSLTGNSPYEFLLYDDPRYTDENYKISLLCYFPNIMNIRNQEKKASW